MSSSPEKDPRLEPPLVEEVVADENGYTGPSRSQVKRDAEAVTKLGQRLTQLPAGVLQHIPLSDELREAIDFFKSLKRGAQARQLRRIGSLLRATDLDRITAAIGNGTGLNPEEKQLEQLGELWRTRLLDGGDDAVEVFLAKYPGGDRTELRQLVRAGRGDTLSERVRRTRRDLLRRIRELIKAANQAG